MPDYTGTNGDDIYYVYDYSGKEYVAVTYELEEFFVESGQGDRNFIDMLGGDDSVGLTAGDDTIDGGDGFDLLVAAAASYDAGFFGLYFYGREVSNAQDVGVAIDLEKGFARFGGVDGRLDVYATNGSVPAYSVELVQFGDYSHAISNFEAVRGTRGQDTLLGDAQDNDFDVSLGGSDRIDGRDGFDVVSFSSNLVTTPVKVDLSKGRATTKLVENDNGTFGGDTYRLKGVEGVIGTFGADTLVGDDNDNLFIAGLNDDIINGGAGADTLSYGKSTFANGASSGVTVLLGEGKATDEFGGVETFRNVENVIGGSFDDSIVGDDTSNTVSGMEGDDTLDGGKGDDTLSYADEGGEDGARVDLEAGTATDTFGDDDEIKGFENVVGGAREDRIAGDDLANEIIGEAGTDNLKGRGGSDTIFGGDDKDLVFGDDGDDELNGENGDDFVYGGDGGDTISGGEGDDNIVGMTGADSIMGDADDDILKDEEMDIDVVGFVNGWRDEMLDGGSGAIPDGANTLRGGDGADTITGVGSMSGEKGADMLRGGVLDGGAGNDTIVASNEDAGGRNGYAVLIGGAGADQLEDGSGTALAYYGYLERGVVLNLETGTSNAGAQDRDRLIDIESATGSRFADKLFSSDSGGSLFGLAGDDRIFALGDGALSTTYFLFAGAGDDSIKANGAQELRIAGDDGDDTISAAAVSGQIDGGDGLDVIMMRGLDGERAAGKEHKIDGRDGADEISFSGYGDTTITGGAGGDVITIASRTGEFSTHQVRTGTGEDVVIVSATSANISIDDFAAGKDILDLSALTGNKSDTFGEFKKTVERQGDGFEVTLGDTTISVADLLPKDLTEDMFIL
jgi:Ca2+-binding RTX toxin-like protein